MFKSYAGNNIEPPHPHPKMSEWMFVNSLKEREHLWVMLI